MTRGLSLAIALCASLAAMACVSGPIAGSGAVPPPPNAAGALVQAVPEQPTTTVGASPTATVTPSASPTPTPTATPTATSAPAPAPPPFGGFFALGAVVTGPGEYRIGTSNWYIEVPAGMRLRWDFVSPPAEDGEVRWGWSDVASGSQVIVSARDVTDVARLMAGDASARALAERNFTALMNSVSRQAGQ